MPRIAIIGAGSVVFAQKLISDILQRPGIRNPEFVLMDIDADRLKLAEIMSKKTAEAMGVKVPIQTTTDRKVAIKNANYVINSVQVGGYPSTKIDFEIPARYGLKQTIADTIGIGGIFRGLRTYPVMKGITEDIMEVGAKGCFLLNYSNPMAMNMLSVWNTGDIPGVGLCHSVQGTSKMLAGRAGVDFADVSYKCGGINHMAFFTELKYKGKDLYPILFQKLLADPGAMGEKVRFEMMKRTGYFVTESSEHQSEYVPYFIHHGEEVIKQYEIPINEYIRRCESIIARWSAQQKEFTNPNKKVEVGAISHEYGSEIINAMETGVPAVIYGNVPNKNLIDNVSLDAVVEVACLVDRSGLQPTHFGKLPTVLAGIVATNVNMQLATIEAAVQGSRELVYHAAMLDPHTSATLTLDKIWAMCDELFEAHKQHLPQFAPVLKGTGRSLESLGETQAHVNVTTIGVPFVDGKKEI
ncbi:MAG: alpha-glucosidase/alpha-galactosidase, partial [Spirochaetia bacterium]|nr:alpha-glucosidase/alpha-galactosidase [Spirochaetia bacterium]